MTMYIKQGVLKKGLSNFAGLLMGALCLGSLQAHATIELHAGELKQKIDIVGGDMERSANFLLKASNPDEIIDWYFSDMVMPYMRVAFDKKQELVEGSPNYAFYAKQIEVMQKIKAVNPDVKFWASLKTDYDGYGKNNNMPDWIYTGNGYNGGSYDPTLFKADKYARFLADYLKLMHDSGVNIDIISVSKEWMQVMPAVNEYNTINNIKQLLATEPYLGIPIPEFNGPAGWGVKQTKNFVKDVSNKGYEANYSGFSAHTYDGPTEASWLELITAASAINKPVYNEESNAAGGGPWWGEEPTIGGVINIYTGKTESYRAGLRGELFFKIWSRGITKETRAVYYTNGQKGNRLRGYWLIKAFIDGVYNKHYIGHSAPDALSDIKVMAFSDDEYVTAYVINTSATNAFTNLPIKLNDKVISSNTIVAQSWSETTPKMGDVTGISKTSDNSFSINIAPLSLNIYKFRIGSNAQLGLSTNQNEISAIEQTFNLDLTTNQPWVVSQLPNWLTVDHQIGDNSKTITFNATENMSNIERAATIYINDVPLLVVQSGGYGKGEGDVNLDGKVDAADLQMFKAVYGLSNLDDGYLLTADLDVDGKITKRDYSQLYAIFLQQ